MFMKGQRSHFQARLVCFNGTCMAGASLTVVEDDESDKESVDKGAGGL